MASKILQIDSPIVTTLMTDSLMKEELKLSGEDKSEIKVSITLSSIIDVELDDGNG